MSGYIDAYNPPRENLLLEYFRRDYISYDIATNTVFDNSNKTRTDQALGHICYDLSLCDGIELDDTYEDVYITWFDPLRMGYRELHFSSINVITENNLSTFCWNIKIWDFDPDLDDSENMYDSEGLLCVIPCESERPLNICRIGGLCTILNPISSIVDTEHRVSGSYYNTFGYTEIDLGEKVHVYLGNLYLNAYNGARLDKFGRAKYDGSLVRSNCLVVNNTETIYITTTADLSSVTNVENGGNVSSVFYDNAGTYTIELTSSTDYGTCYDITLTDGTNTIYRLPLSEGGGNTCKCVKTGLIFDISTDSSWGNQDDFHYNIIYGSTYTGTKYIPNLEYMQNNTDILNCETSVKFPDTPEFLRLNINPLSEFVSVHEKTAQPIFSRYYNGYITNILVYDYIFDSGYSLFSKVDNARLTFDEEIVEIIESDGIDKYTLTISTNEVLIPKDKIIWYLKVRTITDKIYIIHFTGGVGVTELTSIDHINNVCSISLTDFDWHETRLNDWHLRSRRYINYNIEELYNDKFKSIYRYVDSDVLFIDEDVRIVLSTEDKRFAIAVESGESILIVENDEDISCIHTILTNDIGSYLTNDNNFLLTL